MMWRVTPSLFELAWARLVVAWLATGEESAEGRALLQHALDKGVHALDLPNLPDASEVAVGQGRRCEVAVVRLAGAVDGAGYLAHNQPQAERGAEPVDHFCRRGWRALRNPSLDFDVWWYWAEYLDPTDESETATNPLVHYLLDGRHRGLLPLPRRVPRPPAPVSTPRRACLFATYDPDGLVDDCVVAYVEELARHADVYVCADGWLQDGQLDRLSAARAAWVRAHGAHDFGSWSLLARELVGWEALAAYDEVLLANDSCWLVRPLDDVFARMDARTCDFWGLQLTARRFEPEPSQPQSVPLDEVKRSWLPPTAFRYPELVHVGSYFLGLRRPVLDDRGFRRRLDAVRPQRDRANLVQKYETGTTQYLVGQGFDFDTWVPELRANHPIYGPGVFELLAEGFPLFKRRFLVANPYDTPGLAEWKERILAVVPSADVDMFERNLLRVADPDELERSFAIRSPG
jgi:Rhamnan synthesis protein F